MTSRRVNSPVRFNSIQLAVRAGRCLTHFPAPSAGPWGATITQQILHQT